MIVERLLGILEDVEGVVGSFVVDPGGQLLTHSMPKRFDLFDLQLSAVRIARVLRTTARAAIFRARSAFFRMMAMTASTETASSDSCQQS